MKNLREGIPGSGAGLGMRYLKSGLANPGSLLPTLHSLLFTLPPKECQFPFLIEYLLSATFPYALINALSDSRVDLPVGCEGAGLVDP